MPNVENCVKTLAYLRAEPLRFNMDYWGLKLSERDVDFERPSCGTVVCLAGAALILAGVAMYDEDGDLWSNTGMGNAFEAIKFLGLEQEDKWLFYESSWESDLELKFKYTNSQALKVEIAAEQLCRVYPELREHLKPNLKIE